MRLGPLLSHNDQSSNDAAKELEIKGFKTKNVIKNTATAALIAMISAAPIAAVAATDINTPTGSLLSDPRTPDNQQYQPADVTSQREGSMIGYVRSTNDDTYKPAEVVDNRQGSMIENGLGRI